MPPLPLVPVPTVARLVDRSPELVPWELLAAMVPPPRFAEVSFATFRPAADQPTQAAAVEALGVFVADIERSGAERKASWWQRARPAEQGLPGRYLDGGFGVGKTHLLASLWRAATGPKRFCTFVELTHFVGALGFAEAVEALSGSRLLCIDEFELDDPGDTVLISTLLATLTDRGVSLAVTSNTLPDRLGQGRFAAADFRREIQALSSRFEVIRIDGDDYRHRGFPGAPIPLSNAELDAIARHTAEALFDDFDQVLVHLSQVHPSRYGALLEGATSVFWRDVHPIEDQATALRMVVLVDRLYDRGLAVASSGVPLDELFMPDLLLGGYRMKYFRALSRLVSLTRSEPISSPD